MKQLNFGSITKTLEMPNLLEMQKKSFEAFLQADVHPRKRKPLGLEAIFLDVFPIEAVDGSMRLNYLHYELGTPKYLTPNEASVRDGTYSAPLKVWLRLSAKKKSGKLQTVIDQDVTICDLPLMTENGCFVFNGAERVIVSQLHRSPGVIFENDEDKKQSTVGKQLFFARIIPYRGAWVEFEFDISNTLWVRLDRKKKILATTFLRACGLENNSEILKTFYPFEDVEVKPQNADHIIGSYAVEDVVDKSTGEVLWNLDEKHITPIDDKTLKLFIERKVKKVSIIMGNPKQENPAILFTLENRKDSSKSTKEALQEIYKKLRGQDFIVKEQAEQFLENLLFDNLRRYDLSYVGRYKLNKKLMPLYERLAKISPKFSIPSEKKRTLCLEDVIVTLQYLLSLNSSQASMHYKDKPYHFGVDDIDHLGNRRVRAIGELLENQIRVGLAQMARSVRDKMNKEDKTLTPRAMVNAQSVQAITRKFFGTSQLSQFMDQVNPLAELIHKRRLSALGPGGLNRKRAGFEVRDVHHTHYGRVCPIETPEGPNIGLITSLACYARINEYGLLESPYRRVINGTVTKKIDFLTADHEDEYKVAQANTPIDDKGNIVSKTVYARYRADYPIISPKETDYMDISPLQVISVSAALIPFLEHDDANRALMGCNMQRQAVPLLNTEYPFVGTGIEVDIARDSGSSMTAQRGGKVIFSDANIIAIEADSGTQKVDVYRLTKYKRSNQDTCVNQNPLVKTGDTVKKGDILVDGPGMKDGQLALGRNLLVGFLSWEGYNYEDAILVSERLVREDVFTSIHLHEFECEARSTKLGSEEITRDIPNVGAEALSHMDENGIVVPATVVSHGDILVGKVTPKGEQQLTPEERLLKVIFGKKAEDVVDASLKVPPGLSGKVMGTRIFVRKEKLTKAEEKTRMKELEEKWKLDIENLREQKKSALQSIKEIHKAASSRKKEEEKINLFFKLMDKKINAEYEREQELGKQGDDLAVTVNKTVKVYIASRRKLNVGDKLSGRHGNKGVVAKILPEEDMPYMPDGTPLDIVLSPLGIPSRMNVGQLLETMLGWAGKQLNTQMICPVFDGATEEEVREKIKLAKDTLRKKGVPEEYLPDEYCRITLHDGRTGEPFSEKVTIGYMYVMKLIHLVEDKVHARSTGPYSLITRQPLGGKAQFGGQRFGEMEVWAVEGYGATYTLQEFLTVKSDDFVGRTKMYEAIIKGDTPQAPGIPESFKVLVKELQSLGLSIDLLKVGEQPKNENPRVQKKASGKKTAKIVKK
ncbi:MAG TPA: DNA-directed RNA polymerase subunit beta [Elusimicrobiales bacterium]|nr:DNA-directed RNA polymerase subunit beta [Elusimicrobiales bacterium]